MERTIESVKKSLEEMKQVQLDSTDMKDPRNENV